MTKAAFVCNWPNCGKSFKRSEHLNRHRLNHEPVKIFVCDQCPKTFVRSDLLFRHRDRHLKRAARHPYSSAQRSASYKQIRPARHSSSDSHDHSENSSKSSTPSPSETRPSCYDRESMTTGDMLSRDASPRRNSLAESSLTRSPASGYQTPVQPAFAAGSPSYTCINANGHFDITRLLPLPVPWTSRSGEPYRAPRPGRLDEYADYSSFRLPPLKSQTQSPLCSIQALLERSLHDY